MAKTPKFDGLKTNVPRIGRLKYVDFSESKQDYGDQIRVTGDWEPDEDQEFEGGEGHFYLPYAVARAMTEAGVIAFDGFDTRPSYKGEPKFRVVHKGQVKFLREEEGRAKITKVTALDREGRKVQLDPQDDPPAGKKGAGDGDEKSGAAKRRQDDDEPAPKAGKADRPAAAEQQRARPAASAEKPRAWYLRQWAQLAEAHTTAMRVALRSFLDVSGLSIEEYYALPLPERVAIYQAIGAHGTSLMIRTEQSGLGGYVGMTADVDKIGRDAPAEPQWAQVRHVLTGFLPKVAAPARPAKEKPAKAAPAREPDEEREDEDGRQNENHLEGADDDLPF